jgi:Fic family protein
MDGTIHHYCDPVRVPDEMEKIVDFIKQNRNTCHPVALAAKVHHRLVAIHPFDDGNGRVSRLVMNLIVMRAGYPPIVIKNETREEYYLALSKADNGDFQQLLTLFHDETKNSLDLMLDVIGRTKSS